MLLLDTNILSEMMRREPHPAVAAWIVRQRSEDLYTAAVCQAEILAGLAIMPNGRRRTDLEKAAHLIFSEDFADSVLPFDAAAATAYGEIFAARRQAGLPSGTVDLMLAAIARVRGATVVTRNGTDFAGSGVPIINPWEQ